MTGQIAGMLRIKNEERWIGRVIESLRGICETIYIFDDHSTDRTREICGLSENVKIYESPFEGFDEARDKNYLLEKIRSDFDWPWLIHVDGDEELEPDGAAKILRSIERSPRVPEWHWQICYMWDSFSQWRTDGLYENFCRPRMFRNLPGSYFPETMFGGNLHCTNSPLKNPVWSTAPVRLLHYGYMDRATRIRKFEFYNSVDPNNEFEDRYRHIVQGDIPDIPAAARLKWAGPIKLERFQ